MKRLLLYISFLFACLGYAQISQGQNNNRQDSVVQLYGVIMTADSLQAIPGASVIVENKGRGTLTNDQGVFSIVVLKGDNILFSVVGFKDKLIHIPTKMEGNQYSVIQLMVTDTAYLPATIIRPTTFPSSV